MRSLAELADWQQGHAEAALDPDLPIIDAHHHLRRRHDQTYLPCDFLAEFGGHRVSATVGMEYGSGHREEGPHELRPVGETEFVLREVLPDHPGICAGFVGFADLRLGKRVKPILEAHITAGGGRFRGVRQALRWDPAGIGMHGELDPPGLALASDFRLGFAELAPLGLSFDVWAFHHQLLEIVDLARKFPATTLIVNHVGGALGVGPYAERRDETLAQWRTGLGELSRCPNIFMKVGGLGMLYFGFDFHKRTAPPGSEALATAWRPYFNECFDRFGPERCMFESNFPVDKQSCCYATLVNAHKRLAADLTVTERAAYFFGTAARVYRLPTELIGKAG